MAIPIPLSAKPLRAPSRLELYVGIVAALGGCVLASSLLQAASSPFPVEWSVFGLLALAGGAFALKVPSVDVRFSVSDTFLMASALMFGPPPAIIFTAIDSLVMTWHRGWQVPLRRVLFNMAAPPLSLAGGAAVFFWLTGTGPLYRADVPPPALVLPLACFAAVYYILNSGLTAIAVAIEKASSPYEVWRRHFAVMALNYFAAASGAFFLVAIIHFLSFAALAAVIPLCAIFYLAMRSWVGRLDDAERHIAKVDRLYLSTIEALSTAIEAKDGVTSSHIHRVQHYAMELAKALNVTNPHEIKAIQAAALLHDTGKLAVPERILNKPGKLTQTEFETMKTHVDVGADILSSIDFPFPVVPIVRAHHENWDGTGYPRGLRGTDIPIGARILSVVDCYDALTSDRPYRGALTEQAALDIIKSNRGIMYDPLVVDAFERLCRDIVPSASTAPQLQHALRQISLSAEPPREQVDRAEVLESQDALRAFVNLGRIIGGHATSADVASLAWNQLRHVAPGASCAFFLIDAKDRLIARFVAGDAASVLQGLQMKTGERLSGWVAANHQVIANSQAQLDLGVEAPLAGLTFCLAVPLVADDKAVGVLSLYGPEPFKDEQSQALQVVAPHVAQMLAGSAADDQPSAGGARPPLRIVASR